MSRTTGSNRLMSRHCSCGRGDWPIRLVPPVLLIMPVQLTGWGRWPARLGPQVLLAMPAQLPGKGDRPWPARLILQLLPTMPAQLPGLLCQDEAVPGLRMLPQPLTLPSMPPLQLWLLPWGLLAAGGGVYLGEPRQLLLTRLWDSMQRSAAAAAAAAWPARDGSSCWHRAASSGGSMLATSGSNCSPPPPAKSAPMLPLPLTAPPPPPLPANPAAAAAVMTVAGVLGVVGSIKSMASQSKEPSVCKMPTCACSCTVPG